MAGGATTDSLEPGTLFHLKKAGMEQQVFRTLVVWINMIRMIFFLYVQEGDERVKRDRICDALNTAGLTPFVPQGPTMSFAIFPQSRVALGRKR
jgi:hypothetical protein